MNLDKEMLKGYIDIIIVSLLIKIDMYGYELCKRIRDECNNDFEIKEATLYLSLKRLENNMLVTSYWDSNNSNGGRRKYYKITEEGIRYFEKKKVEWQFLKNILERFLEGVKDD